MTGRGRFITLEGGEGAGKTTLARSLAQRLEAAGVEAVVTREPGGTLNAEAVRALLVEGEADRWSPMAETLLLYAARRDHLERLIEPALARGAWVISDRFADSTRAYQGAAGRLDPARIEAIHAAALDGFEPDLTLIVDLDPQTGLERTRSRGEAATRFERHPPDFHARLRQGFLDIAARHPARCAVIHGAAPAETVLTAALAILRDRLDAPA